MDSFVTVTRFLFALFLFRSHLGDVLGDDPSIRLHEGGQPVDGCHFYAFIHTLLTCLLLGLGL